MHEPGQIFRLAEMSRSIWILTAALLALPVGMLGATLLGVADPALLGVAGLLGLLYLGVWLWFRPGHFELSPVALSIVWPMRRRDIALASIESAQIVTSRELRAECGLLLRIGVGGLWGGFGRLWSSKGVHLDFYVSRTAPLVLVRQRRGRHLLITPEQPERFVDALQGLDSGRRE